ncbi:hypothetical protein JY97_13030 [Alkalispirochaeta odontotermitis]|nr:hypothetical protein JY97_13030 [Alkalispirochaeta odontotermitis]CAB1072327.1 hypothetical protein D1AOALGA4SA_1538 [Olavius algarvensis Delta 1 endosymbiont]
MHILRNMKPYRILLVIAIIMLSLIFFQALCTSAQTSSDAEEIAKQDAPAPEAIIALIAQLKQASAQISKLEARLDLLENRERTLQNKHRELVDEMTILRDLTERAIALNADDRKKPKKIEKVIRLTGGRPGQKDMVVSINKYSITWNQIDTILNKLDEITRILAQPESRLGP